jgi:tetratricopeptide (TPR) repeat protein
VAAVSPVEPPRELPPPPRMNLEGSGVVRARGPGIGPIALIGLAAILAAIAVFIYVRKPRRLKVAQLPDATQLEPVDAGEPIVTPIYADAPDFVELDAPQLAAIDAGTPIDAVEIVIRPADAGTQAAGGIDAGVDKVSQAKQLMDEANNALQEGDFDKALDLAEKSLKLRKTARTYLVRAQALQRLDRIEDALASIDAAQAASPTYASVYELRGRILWAARRKEEAREAYHKFLELEPNTARAAQVRALLDSSP